MKKKLEDGTEVEMTPEEELTAVKKDHDDLKVQVATLEMKTAVQQFTAETIEPLIKHLVTERHMTFPAGGQPEGEFSVDELLIGKYIMDDRRSRKLDADYKLQDQLDVALRTMTTGGAATGAELLESPILAKLWEDVRLATKVASLFAPIINMPGKTLDLPTGLGDVTFYKPAGEGHAVPAKDLGTAKRTLTAYPLKAQVDISDELDQDSIIALLPSIRAALVRNGAQVTDKVILNADIETAASTNVNSGDGTPAGDEDYLIGFDGLRKYCLVTNTGQVDSTTEAPSGVAAWEGLLSLLGKYAANPARLAWIIDVFSYVAALGMTELKTMDQIGEKATMLTGQIGAVYGTPVVVSEQLVKCEDGGLIYTTAPVNNTDGTIILVHRDMWKVGIRKPLRVATERSEAKGLTSLVATIRLALQSFDANGVHTALHRDLTV